MFWDEGEGHRHCLASKHVDSDATLVGEDCGTLVGRHGPEVPQFYMALCFKTRCQVKHIPQLIMLSVGSPST